MWKTEFIMHVHVLPAVEHEALLICDWNKKASYKICLYWYELSDSEIFHIIHASTKRKGFMCLSNLKVTFILITLNMNMNYATALRKKIRKIKLVPIK